MWKEAAVAYLRYTCLEEQKKTMRNLSHYSQFLGVDWNVVTSQTPVMSNVE
jgi:hypothetical protein